MRDVDIVLNVTTTSLPVKFQMLNFHRIISDEIHSYRAPGLFTLNLWGLTATPFSRIKMLYDKLGVVCENKNNVLLTSWKTLQRNIIRKNPTLRLKVRPHFL